MIARARASSPLRIAMLALPLAVSNLACAKTRHERDRDIPTAASTSGAPAISLSGPVTVPAAASATTSASAASVPCGIPAAPLPTHAKDSQTFTSVLKTRRRLEVLGVEGRLLFAGATRAVTPHGPATEYVNRFHELAGDTIRPAAGLQRGLWPDLSLLGAWGHWPDGVLMVAPNYGNSAWEIAGFQWDAGKRAWVNRDIHDASSPRIPWGWGSPWEWSEEKNASSKRVLAISPVGVPDDLCDGVASCKSLLVVAPRDLYTTTGGCARAEDPKCAVTRILHWCAPRSRFEESMAPRAIANAHVIAVPGTALVYGGNDGQEPTFDYGWTFRDGQWASVAPPEASFHRSWLIASGGSIWYLGTEGLYRLGERGFTRVSPWHREHGNTAIVNGTANAMGRSKLTLPGADGPAALTGFLASTADELWVTTWNGKETQIWSTSADRKIRGK